MAKKDSEMEVFESQVIQGKPDVPPVVLSQVLQELGLSGPQRKAEELIDQQFTIVRARAFPSKYEGQDHAYYCVCADKNGEIFTIVLGGFAVVDVLDALRTAAPDRAYIVTLRFKEGGRYSGYYVLE